MERDVTLPLGLVGRVGRVGLVGKSSTYLTYLTHLTYRSPAAHLSPMKPLIIAIDGPSGAGKGTVARSVAEKLGYRHVDSGAMYRAVAWQALHTRVSLDDEERVAELAERSHIDMSSGRVKIDAADVTSAIRTPEIDHAAAAVARLPKVRAVLVSRQRELGTAGAIVMEGRDIGTVVFPEADVKIYLDAAPEERARRRANDPAHSTGSAPVSDVAAALSARDELDRTRAASPLYAAADAVLVDTTGKSIAEVVQEVMAKIEEKRVR
jgi:CMP/dCMP kinase